MPFVRRNAEGEIEAVFVGPENGANEEVPPGSEELSAFMSVSVLDIIKKGKYKYNPERKYEKEPEVTFKFANTSGNPIRNERNLRLVSKLDNKDVNKDKI